MKVKIENNSVGKPLFGFCILGKGVSVYLPPKDPPPKKDPSPKKEKPFKFRYF
tara:strand:+ start:45 stop:203 length:159 start_codon:yes stop_codon:yes gene_type:complete